MLGRRLLFRAGGCETGDFVDFGALGGTHASSKEGKHLIHKLVITEFPSSHHGAQDIALDILVLVLLQCELGSLLAEDIMEDLSQVIHILGNNVVRSAGDP